MITIYIDGTASIHGDGQKVEGVTVICSGEVITFDELPSFDNITAFSNDTIFKTLK